MTTSEPDATTPTGPLSDRIVDSVLRSVISGVMKLPYERRVATMGSLVSRGIGPLAGYKRRAKKNIAKIYRGLGNREQSRMATAVLDNFGRTLIENYSWRELGERLRGTEPSGDGLDAVMEAHNEGRPILFVTGHFGNHEAPRHILTQRGLSVGGLYRPMKNAYVNAHYAKTMTEMSGPVFAQGRRGTAGFARHLKQGGAGTLLFDVNNADGNVLPFLGAPARTATSAADLALRLDALLVPYFGIRNADGITFDIRIEDPVAHSTPEDMLLELTKRLETQIERNPAQWFWVHNRWKV